MRRFFKDIKYAIKHWIELQKFFVFKKSKFLNYDDTTKKYYVCKHSALADMISTWGGDYDLLNALRLKIEHSYYNLKHYGNTVSMYIDDWGYIESCFAFDYLNKDRKFFCKKMSQILHNFDDEYCQSPTWHKTVYACLENDYPTFDLNFDFSNKKDKEHTIKCKQIKMSFDWENEERNILSITRIPYGGDYIYYYSFDKVLFEKDIKQEFTHYVFENDDLVPKKDYRYKETSSFNLWKKTTRKPMGIEEIYESVVDYTHLYFIDVVRRFVDFIVELSDMKDISDDLKSRIVGNRRTLKDLLELRRYVKKLCNLSDTDDKYYNMWKDSSLEERQKKLQESYEIFKNDRRELYQKVCNLMSGRGLYWWD